MDKANLKFRNNYIAILVFLILLALASSALATGPLYKTTTASRMSNRFLRGVLNIPLSVMEIPKALNINIKNTDYFTGTLVGLGEGIYKTSKRLSYGVLETLTFPCLELKTFDTLVDSPIPFKELAE